MNIVTKTKECSCCRQEKPISEFYKRNTTKDGLRYECKLCARKSTRKYYSAHKKERSKYDREYRLTPRYKELARLRRTLYKNRTKAKNAVNNAIRDGRLDPPYRSRCIICRFRRGEQYHHPDYAKPMFAFPICRSCHNKIHLLP